MSAAARLLYLLIRERDELLNAAALDEREPLPPMPGPYGAGTKRRQAAKRKQGTKGKPSLLLLNDLAGAGKFCPTRVAELVSSWGRLGERERLHRAALTELAPTSLYATLAPILGDAMAAHQALMDALGDEEVPDMERHCKALAALQTHLPAINAALAGRPPLPDKDDTRVRGTPGRRGYSLEALRYALDLRAKNPDLKAHALRKSCLEHYREDDLPPDADSFRAWLNRPRKRT